MSWWQRNRRYFVLFGALAGVGTIVWINARIHGDLELAAHIATREIAVHLGWGVAAYCLIQRLLLFLERSICKRTTGWLFQNFRNRTGFGWFGWFLGPAIVLLTINTANEFLLGFTLPPEGAACTWCGDWQRAGSDWALKLKSVADLATWAFSALAAAWFCYFTADRQSIARRQFLTRKSRR